MSQFFYPLLFIFGTAVGSFLNVVIWRYRPERFVLDFNALSGRSHCPYCRKELRWFELVPLVSFLIQCGRCRSCKHKLSLQYPTVELIAGLIFVLLPLFLNRFYDIKHSAFAALGSPNWYYGLAFAWIAVFLVWLIITAIDLRYFIIPNELNVALVVLGIIITAIVFGNHDMIPAFRDSFLRHYSIIFSPSENIFMNRLLGVFAGGLFFGILSFVSRGKAMGMGDAKLAAASGLILGWPDIGLAILLSFIFGGIIGTIFLISGRRKMKDKIAFGPIFILGMVTVIFLGYQIIREYFELLSF